MLEPCLSLEPASQCLQSQCESVHLPVCQQRSSAAAGGRVSSEIAACLQSKVQAHLGWLCLLQDACGPPDPGQTCQAAEAAAIAASDVLPWAAVLRQAAVADAVAAAECLPHVFASASRCLWTRTPHEAPVQGALPASCQGLHMYYCQTVACMCLLLGTTTSNAPAPAQTARCGTKLSAGIMNLHDKASQRPLQRTCRALRFYAAPKG